MSIPAKADRELLEFFYKNQGCDQICVGHICIVYIHFEYAQVYLIAPLLSQNSKCQHNQEGEYLLTKF